MQGIRLAIAVVAMSLSATAFAEPEAKGPFAKMKELAGEWEGKVTTAPSDPSVEGMRAEVTIRVTSRGHAVLHEMRMTGRPDDPITMFYVDGDRLLLTHYCDAGNRPRMVGKEGADGKTVQFEFLDIAGSTQHGHMHNAGFRSLSPDHHIEEWSYMAGDGKEHVRARFDLRRKK